MFSDSQDFSGIHFRTAESRSIASLWRILPYWACRSIGVSRSGCFRSFRWVKSGWCMYQAPRCFTSGCEIPMCRDVAFPKMSVFFGINKILKSHEEPWLKQMLFREVTECGTDIAQLIHHASSQTILFKNNIFQSGKFNSLRKKNTSWHHMSSVEPVEPVELTEISLKMAPRSATPKAEKPDRAEAARQRWAEASSLG